MGRVLQHRGNAPHIVVVGKAEQMFALIKRPRLRAELTVQAVCDLKQVHTVEAGIQALIALIIGHTMAHFLVGPAVIIAVQSFAQKPEIALLVGESAQCAQKIRVQTIGHIQPQAVNVILCRPLTHGLHQMLRHRRVAQVQLYQLVVPLPAFVPKAVVVFRIAVKIQVKPVFIRAFPAIFLHILKRPEAAPHMVEHTIQHHTDACGVQGITHIGQILIGAKAAVHCKIITGIITVAITLEHRVQQHTVCPCGQNMRHPILDLCDRV